LFFIGIAAIAMLLSAPGYVEQKNHAVAWFWEKSAELTWQVAGQN